MAFARAMLTQATSAYSPLPAPTGLTVTQSTDSSISFVWQSVSGAHGYAVYRDGSMLTPPSPVTDPNYTDTGLLSGTTYEYTVSALTASGSSGPTAYPPVPGTTTGPPPPIRPPTNVSVLSTTATEITLAWTPVSMASSYNIYRNGVHVNNSTVTAATFTDCGLSPQTTYTYTVTALRGSTESAPSQPVSGTTGSSFVCQEFYDNNYDHVESGRATQVLGFVYANGSQQYMGLYNIAQYVNLAEIKDNYYIVGSCPKVPATCSDQRPK